MEKTYFITQEQLAFINNYNKSILAISNLINSISNNSEKTDMSIGFDLGKIYSDLREHYFKHDELKKEISSNQILDENT